VGGRPIGRSSHAVDLTSEGYSFDEKMHTLTIRHTSSRDVDIQGDSGSRPPSIVTFDDPHIAAGTTLTGTYPGGVIDWGPGAWQIGAPSGKFGTFTLALSSPAPERTAFRFVDPVVFVGMDAYNGGESDATITVSSPETREATFVLKPGELRRIRTGWRDPSSRVDFAIPNGEAIRFDNLAYLRR
jgi:hypothetical protein